MATVTPTGESHIHAAYFCYSAHLELYFVSDPSTVHCQNLAHSKSMAVAVFSTSQPWDMPHQGVQLFGTARRASPIESAKALPIHAKRFHAYGDYMRALNPVDKEATPHKFYVFRPESMRLFDEPAFGEETFIDVWLARD